MLGYSARTALTVALGLAQIGEFSFILSELARRYQLMPDEGHNVLVASAILSITLNPFLFRQLPAIEGWLRRHPGLWKLLNARAEHRLARETKLPEQPSADKSGRPRAIVIGYGPVGRTIHHVLEESGLDVVIVDMNMETISTLRRDGKSAIYGDACNGRILEEAGLSNASHLVVTVPDGGHRAAIITAARALNPSARVVVRARYISERAELERHGVSEAVFEEAEAAVAMARLVMNTSGLHRDEAREKLREIRFRLALESFREMREIRVASVMIPAARLHGIHPGMDRATALTVIERNPHRFYPVLDPQTREPIGCVETETLAAGRGKDGWQDCIRPLCEAGPEETVGDVFATMLGQAGAMCAIRQAGQSLGIVTRGHLLDHIENAFGMGVARRAPVRLADAIARGAIVCPLVSTDRDSVIRELTAHAPAALLPPGIDAEALAGFVFSREAEISTDLGNGIALPHARCPGLVEPFVIVGHADHGIAYSLEAEEPAHLFFLLATPAEQPEAHLALLGQIARMMADPAKREALRAARSPVELAERLA